MNSLQVFFTVVCIALFCVVFPSKASALSEAGYAEKLYKSGSYFQCIDELRKESFYFGRDNRTAEYLITCCYFMGGQYKTALLRLENGVYAGLSFDASILLAKTFARLGDYKKSYETTSSLFYEGRSAEERYLLLMSRLEPLLYLNRVNGDSLLKELEAYEKHEDGTSRTASLGAKLKDYDDIPFRSPAAAVAMSAVLPGLGQAYCGRFLDGLMSLIGVCGAGVGGLFLYRSGERALACGAFFLSALFYAGNIYGSYNGAQRFNLLHRQRYRDEILSEYMPPYDPAAAYFGRRQ